MNYKKEPGIYIFTNKINGKKYVGETIDIKRRIKRYYNPKENRPFEHALRKYGFDGFDLKIMYFPVITKKELLDLEETFIFLESSLVTEHGYNVCGRGLDNTGIKRSEESKKKQSITVSGSGNSMYGVRMCGEDNHMYGKKRPEMSERQSGTNNYMYGKTGDKHPNSKKINQYTKDGIFIKEFASIIQASNELLISDTNIISCAKGKPHHKSAGGFIWKYALN